MRIAGGPRIALCLVVLQPKRLDREGVLWAEHQVGESPLPAKPHLPER
jgi:hypothetical protein